MFDAQGCRGVRGYGSKGSGWAIYGGGWDDGGLCLDGASGNEGDGVVEYGAVWYSAEACSDQEPDAVLKKELQRPHPC